jgi:putative salt-induced outer membrane protein YdiY
MMTCSRIHSISRTGLLAVVLGLPLSAQAIVNVEGLRSGSQQPGLGGSVSLSVNGASGNTDKMAANASGRLNWQRSQSITFLIASYSFGETNQTRNTNKAFGHLRHVYQYTERMAFEGFVQAERNEFTRLTLRTLAGAGVRQRLHKSDNGQANLGLGAFRSAETLDEQPGLTDSGTERLWRANIYLALDYAFNKQLRIESTTYYQPSTKDQNDYRLLEQAALKVSINDSLAIKLTLDIARDSQPPQAIKETDVSYLTGLEYKF